MKARATAEQQQPRTNTDTTNHPRLRLPIGVLKLALGEVEQLAVHEEGVRGGIIEGVGGEIGLGLGEEVVKPGDMPKNWGCSAVPSVMACRDDRGWRDEGYNCKQWKNKVRKDVVQTPSSPVTRHQRP